MNSLLSVVPLARFPRRAPQQLSYTTTAPTPPGALVRIAVGNRTVNAVVFNTIAIADAKATIKKLPYQLKPIESVLVEQPVLFPWQMQMIRWLTAEFYEPATFILRTMLPRAFETRKTAPFVQETKSEERKTNTTNKPTPVQPSFVAIPFNDRIEHYRQAIDQSKTTLIVCPSRHRRDRVAEELSLPIFDTSLKGSVVLERWNAIRSGAITAAVGTRSALMAPFPHLATMIIENESSDHHASWDQHPRIDVRWAAEWLAHHGTTVVFGDLLPTIERTIRYGADDVWQSHNTTPAHGIDLRTAERDEHAPTLSYQLTTALEETVRQQKRALLFVARRGAATFILCQDCGYHFACPDCAIPLVLHTHPNKARASAEPSDRLHCHHCGYNTEPPATCPHCQSSRIRYGGIGTQRVEKELTQRFPTVPVLRIDADTVDHATLTAARETSPALIVGTDLVLDDPRIDAIDISAAVTLETLLHLPDYSAAERTVRTITQLRSKAQRATYIQAYEPDNETLARAIGGNLAEQYRHENTTRAALSYPPHAILILCRYQHTSQQKAHDAGTMLKERLRQQVATLGVTDVIEILGPAPAFYAQRRRQHHIQLLIKWKPLTRFTSPDKNRTLRTRLLSIIPQEWDITLHPVSLL